MSTFSINTSPAYPFAQKGSNATAAIAATVASANEPIPGGGGDSLVFSNTSTGWAFITITNGATTAVLPTPGIPKSGLLIPPGGQASYSLVTGADGKQPSPVTHVNAILTAGTGNIYFSLGSGQ